MIEYSDCGCEGDQSLVSGRPKEEIKAGFLGAESGELQTATASISRCHVAYNDNLKLHMPRQSACLACCSLEEFGGPNDCLLICTKLTLSYSQQPL